jgi:hypothetical protein
MLARSLGIQQQMTIASIEPNQPTDSRALTESGEAPKSVAWTQHLWRQLLSWTICAALASGGLGLLADGVRLAWARAPLRIVLAGALCSPALAILLSLFAGPVLALVSAAGAWLARGGVLRKALSPLPVALLAGLAAFTITQVRHHQDTTMRNLLIGATTVALLTIAFACARSAPRMVRLFAVAFGISAFLLDALVPRWYYREIHDLLGLVTVAGGLAILSPLRRRLLQKSLSRRFGVTLILALVLAIAVVKVVDVAAPGWRAQSERCALYGPALARAGRALVDFDRDGFSPVFWGGDCDDFDAHRNPLASDGPGKGDANCNGVDPPAAPTDAQRGLLPAAGDANLGPQAIDLVVLATVDALRADSLVPSLMPHLVAASAGGVLFERAYSSGTRTSVTLPLVQTGSRKGLPLGKRLASAGVATSIVVADAGMEGLDAMAPSFERVVTPTKGRWPGVDATDRALRLIDEVGSRRHYLWVHYYDAHTPYPAAANPPFPVPVGLHSSYARYAAGVVAADLALGKLLDGLSQRGRLARALIIVGSDHGESFGEHGMLFHAASAYEPVVRIPLVLLAPGIAPIRYRHLVCHGDVFPTILGALGMAQDEDESYGRSWLRLRTAPDLPLHGFVFVRSAQAASGGDVMSPLLAIVDDRYKLIKTVEDSLVQLFDVVDDPGEKVDLLHRLPAVARRLELSLETYRDVIGYPADEDLADLKTFGERRLDPDGNVF